MLEKLHSFGNSIHTQYELEELELITTIGVGAFGRVELVRPVGDETHSYALKRMTKSRFI